MVISKSKPVKIPVHVRMQAEMRSTGFNVRDLLNLQEELGSEDEGNEPESRRSPLKRTSPPPRSSRSPSLVSSGGEEADIEEEDELAAEEDLESMSGGLSTPPNGIELGELTSPSIHANSMMGSAYYDHENPYTRWLQTNDAMQAYTTGEGKPVYFNMNDTTKA